MSGNTDLGDLQAGIGSMSAGFGFWSSVVIGVIFSIVGITMIVYGLIPSTRCSPDIDSSSDACKDKSKKTRDWILAGSGLFMIIVMGAIVALSYYWRKIVNTNRTTQQLGGLAAEAGFISNLFSSR